MNDLSMYCEGSKNRAERKTFGICDYIIIEIRLPYQI